MPFTRYFPGECGSVMALTRRFSGRSFSQAHCAIADEEALIGCQSVAGLQVLPLRGVFPGDVGQQVPPRSATSSPLVSLLLILISSTTVYCAYWSRTQCGALLKVVGVLLGPPVSQVALGVELAALVVEAVGQLVADGARRYCRSSARRPSSGS